MSFYWPAAAALHFSISARNAWEKSPVTSSSSQSSCHCFVSSASSSAAVQSARQAARVS